ncbi:MAG: hypothetical protein ACYC6Y_21025 [Thermoguttaceae bacterium]
METRFADIREKIGLPCVWSVEKFPRPNYILRTREDDDILMTLSQKWFWDRDAAVEFFGFSGVIHYEIETLLPFMRWPALAPFFELVGASTQTRVHISDGKRMGVAEWNSAIRPQGFDIHTDAYTYTMFVQNRRLNVCDGEGALVEADCLDNGLTIVRWTQDVELVLALAFWWLFHGADAG